LFLDVLIQKGDRLLVFTQFVHMLDILERMLSLLDIPFYRMDGTMNVRDRQELINSFNTEGCEANMFLLSTKACGMGVNLTSANSVILYDQDFVSTSHFLTTPEPA
jgi:SNF2 family DNA or RNA helicase